MTVEFAEAISLSEPTSDETIMNEARSAVIDFLACAFAGAADRSTIELIRVLGRAGGNVPIIGHTKRTDAYTAALINGHAGHVLDYDDVHPSVRGHPTTVIVPALLAVEETMTAEGFLSAYVVGLEAMARLGLAMGMRHYERGFHSTGTLGGIAVAAAVSHSLNLGTEKTAVALGLAATQAAGLRLQFGYDAKPLHAGLAARAGLTAVRLAQAGFSGAPDFLEGPISFFEALAFDAATPSLATKDFGQPWQLIRPGLTLKAFPCCTASHPVAIGALELRAEGAFTLGDIETITLTFPPGGDAALVSGASPVTGIEARFSAEYVFAAAFSDGMLSLNHFSESPTREGLLALSRKISRRHDQNAPRMSSDPETRFVTIEVLLNNGGRIEKHIRGLPENADPSAKFADATKHAEGLAGIPALVRSMTTADDLSSLRQLINQPA